MLKHVVIASVALVITACTTASDLHVRTEHTSDVDFTALKTFRMAAGYPEGVEYQRYARGEQLAREVIEEELISRGYERITDGPADFRVEFETIFRGYKTDTTPGGGTRAEQPTGPTSASSSKGTMIIRILHPHTRAVLWEGSVSGIRVDPVRPKEEMRKAAWRLLAEFPPLI